MKKLLILTVVLLQGCSIAALTTLWPKPHDPVMFDQVVSVKLSVDKLNCDDKNWTEAEYKIQHLKVYAELRNDPQATSIAQLGDAIQKAADTKSEVFCEDILKINKARIEVVADAWKGR